MTNGVVLYHNLMLTIIFHYFFYSNKKFMLMSCHVLETQILEQYMCFLLTVELMCVNIDRTYQIPWTAQLIAWENSGQHESSVGQQSLTRANTPRVWLEPDGRRSMHRSLWLPNSCLIRGRYFLFFFGGEKKFILPNG